MTDDEITALTAKLRELYDEWGEAMARAAFEQKTAGLSQEQRTQIEALVFFGSGNQFGAVTVGDVAGEDVVKGAVNNRGTVTGAAVGVNQGTVQLFFGQEPPPDAKGLLTDYLTALHDQVVALRLARMGTQRKDVRGTSLLPPLHLADVFTHLITDGDELVLYEEILPAREAEARLKQADVAEHTADAMPPEDVRRRRLSFCNEPDAAFFQRLGKREQLAISDLPGETLLRLQVTRPLLAIESLARQARLVLLGAPGSGKSTVFTYVVLLLTTRTLPSGWSALPVPVLCPLGLVASALGHKRPEQSDASVLWDVLAHLLTGVGEVRKGLDQHLRPALRRGGVVLCFDGLDEIPATPGPDGVSLRTRVSRAVQSVARELPRTTQIALTCRQLSYEQPTATPVDAWTLPADDGWVVQHLQPFTFGQVRQFVTNWYAAACQATDASYRVAEGERRAAALLTQLRENVRLGKLIESPLLLTLLTLLHYNNETGELPRDRARLYDECVELLLERWEPVRQPDVQIPGLLERLGIAQLASNADLRAVLHQVALHAHDRPPDLGDGRGRLRGSEIEGELSRFLRKLRCDQIEVRLAAFEQALRDETGLLQELGDDIYAFPHLTFQEYLAACGLSEVRESSHRAYAYWSGAEGAHWYEVLLLMVGRLRQLGAIDRQGMEWLRTLLNPCAPGGMVKSVAQHGRDALLAAESYVEWEGRVALRSYEAEEIDQLEGRIARALTVALERGTMLPFETHLRAARHLATLGDSRFPVTTEQWQAEWARHNETFGQPNGYWCYVRAGAYRIGGWKAKEPAATISLSAFWLARYPITVAQYAPFVAEGYGNDAERWWTKKGWQWKQGVKRTQPWGWNDATYNGANQPVIGLTWYEATAYCAWLSDQIAAQGYELRLPTEAEWEAAAAYDAQMQRRNYPWGADEPTPERAIYDASKLDRPAPVGCCPAGAAACGALDLAGNVWEWTTSSYKGYPAQSGTLEKGFTPDDFDVPLRGGSYRYSSTNVRCGARGRSNLSNGSFNGFRVVLAPRSHKGSDF